MGYVIYKFYGLLAAKNYPFLPKLDKVCNKNGSKICTPKYVLCSKMTNFSLLRPVPRGPKFIAHLLFLNIIQLNNYSFI